jgi:hypothetical protein
VLFARQSRHALKSEAQSHAGALAVEEEGARDSGYGLSLIQSTVFHQITKLED